MPNRGECDKNYYCNDTDVDNSNFFRRASNIEKNCIKIQQEYIPQILEETLSVLKNLTEILDNYLTSTEGNKQFKRTSAVCNCKQKPNQPDEDNVSCFRNLWLLERTQKQYQIKKFMDLLDKNKHL